MSGTQKLASMIPWSIKCRSLLTHSCKCLSVILRDPLGKHNLNQKYYFVNSEVSEKTYTHYQVDTNSPSMMNFEIWMFGLFTASGTIQER